MLKIIDLDSTGKDKDRDAFVFTLTVAGEKVGVSEDELADLIRAKAGGQKSTAKKGARRAQGTTDSVDNDNTLDGEAADKGTWSNRQPEGETNPNLV